MFYSQSHVQKARAGLSVLESGRAFTNRFLVSALEAVTDRSEARPRSLFFYKVLQVIGVCSQDG